MVYVGKDCISFGKYDDPASWRKYAEWSEQWKTGKILPSPDSSSGGTSPPDGALNTSHSTPAESVAFYVVADLMAAFLDYAERELSSQYDHFRLALRWIRVAGHDVLPVEEFSPKKLKDVRQSMVDGETMCYNHINDYKNRIIRMFRWGTEEEIVKNPDIVLRLKAVENLKKGAYGTFANPKTKGVPEWVVFRTLPGLPPVVRAMVLIQLFTGMRPNEVFLMRVGDLDMSRVSEKGLWYYEPGSYKTRQYVGDIQFPLNKPLQELIAPYLVGKKPEEAVFSPRQAMVERNEMKRAKRKSKLTPSQRERDEQNAKKPMRVGDFYNRTSYRNAIQFGIKAVNSELPDNEKVPQWTPYRMRNTAARRIKMEYGGEVAQAQLAHTSGSMTERYADTQLIEREELALKQENSFREKLMQLTLSE